MFLVLFYDVFEVKKFNGIISKTVRLALNTLGTSREMTFIHDVKVSCIVSRVVEVATAHFIGIVFKVFEVEKFNGIMFQDCIPSAPNRLWRHVDDVIHDVKVSWYCISGCRSRTTTLLVPFPQVFEVEKFNVNNFKNCALNARHFCVTRWRHASRHVLVSLAVGIVGNNISVNFGVFKVKKCNGITVIAVLSMLDSFISRDDAKHVWRQSRDVKVSSEIIRHVNTLKLA